MDNVITMVLIFVNVKKNFEIFSSMSPSLTALSKSYVVPKIGTVRMIHVEKVIPVALNAKFQCVWNAIVPRLIAIRRTRCPQLLSSMT